MGGRLMPSLRHACPPPRRTYPAPVPTRPCPLASRARTHPPTPCPAPSPTTPASPCAHRLRVGAEGTGLCLGAGR
ncbi:hypothetical protein GUJ93_ZPchr0010g11248 [Zizania palustris]|uniref:Uncharacterized protein n=1 Tax=Zizania palustris TaxID=103762 RepID=A0A8J6BM62_ZIZPA|nr:hypothetical protein GUJ93_ZPchr0010g11248 [Zizania palustris]